MQVFLNIRLLVRSKRRDYSLFAPLAHRFGRRRSCMIGALVGMLSAVQFFLALDARSTLCVVGGGFASFMAAFGCSLPDHRAPVVAPARGSNEGALENSISATCWPTIDGLLTHHRNGARIRVCGSPPLISSGQSEAHEKFVTSTLKFDHQVEATPRKMAQRPLFAPHAAHPPAHG